MLAPAVKCQPVQPRHEGFRLLDLPLELIRPIIRNVLTTTELRDSIRIREINKLFDDEVMVVIESEKLLRASKGGRLHKRTTGGIARLLQSEFMASYILRRPHKQSPWNANISSMLNAVLDDVLTRENTPLDAPIRRDYLLRLCCVARQKARHLSVVPFLFMSRETWQSIEPFDYVLLQAHIITGQPVLERPDALQVIGDNLRTNAYVLGTFLNNAIWGRQYDLARYILAKSSERGDNRYASASFHEALPAAIINDDIKMVELLFEPAWNHNAHGPDFESAIRLAIQLGRTDITSFLLGRAGDEPMYHVSHDGLREACFNGDIDLVRRILDRHDDICIDADQVCASNCWTHPDLFGDERATPVQVAAKEGHEELLRLLIARGANPYGFRHRADFTNIGVLDLRQASSLSYAACGGHTGIASILLKAGIELSPEQWIHVIRCAIEFGHTDFLRFLIASGTIDVRHFSTEYKTVTQNLMALFSRYGDTEAIKLFAEENVPVDGPLYEPDRTPMMVALAFKQDAAVDVLLEYGAAMVDITRVRAEDSFSSDNFLMERAKLQMHPRSRAGVSF
ncbi:ankyrin repeat-containing domain protein [Xylariaceae sp. FL0016]|nr:ankyrin repeat-containing domain protein [Xylariaceae sp. FL0016]